MAEGRVQGLGLGLNIGASIITNTILRVPSYNYSIILYPNPILNY